jgi:hypothetical protein
LLALLLLLLLMFVIIELKDAIAKPTGIPVAGQRLIFSGKHLNPENKLLSDFNISNEASIHLFPRLVNGPPPSGDGGQQGDQASASGAASSSGGQRIVRIVRGPQGQGQGPPAGLFADYNSNTPAAEAGTRGIHRTVPEVRLWCYILFFSSFMTLFDHLSFIINTGKLCVRVCLVLQCLRVVVW